MDASSMWQRFRNYLLDVPAIGLTLDISRMNFADRFMATMEPHIQQAFSAMDLLEEGGIANPDENRMVGHYWLRNPDRAPSVEIAASIRRMVSAVKAFTGGVHSGTIVGETGKAFRNILVIGIGGSALGPQFVADALGGIDDPVNAYFLDNTDPDGMDRVLGMLGSRLDETLCIVISKSGGTKETRNGMLEARMSYEREGLSFARHAVAVTGAGSELDTVATTEGWLGRFPMWDWVGGRTSVTSAVGLLPAALQGIDIDALLEGARICDEITRTKETCRNPAALLALMWFYATNGKGERDMVILPYKDRLVLFSRYLQQLIMESIGKELDLAGKTVNQGIAVYGNKGSTDQHAYVQQLRDGVNNFFVTFIEVLQDRRGDSQEVESGFTSGDYLFGFMQGTRQALYEKGRESVTITIDDVSPQSVGMLIALYERTVGLYASLVNINAYHQPGVEAGKKGAATLLKLQEDVVALLRRNLGEFFTCDDIAEALGIAGKAEEVFHIMRHLSANPDRKILEERREPVFQSRYCLSR